MKNNYDDIKDDMTNWSIIKFIFFNSFFCIMCKVLVTLKDSITVSFLGHLQGYKLSPYFIACLIKNIGFNGTGFGISNTANMLASRFLGENKLDQLGHTINKGRIILFIYSLLCILFSFTGKGLLTLLFPDVNVDLVCTYLTHNSLSIILNFQTVMYIIYLNVNNNYFCPAVIDIISTITQFVIFKVIFSVYSDYILLSEENTFIVTAWCWNLTYFLQFLYYSLYVYFTYSKSESYVPFGKDSFRLGTYLYLSLHFIFFFVSHFLRGEQLNILINNYYGKKTILFDAFSISQKIYFLLQKIAMGFSFFLINVTGYLVMKKKYTILRKITKIYFISSFSIIVTFVALVEILADPISSIYTDKEDILEHIPFYMRVISLVILPFHLEISLQSILTGHNKQKFAAYFSIVVTVVGGLGFGFLFIYGLDFGVEGIFITMFIIEILFFIVNLVIALTINTKSEVKDDSLLTKEDQETITTNHLN